MSLTHRFATEYSTNPKSKTRIITNLLLASTLAVIACLLIATPTAAHAQGSLQIGLLTTTNTFGPCLPPNLTCNCPPGQGWYTYGTTSMTCEAAVMTCPNTAPLNLTFGYLNPVGVLTNLTYANGVIVYLTGDAGTAPGNNDYLNYYFQQGYMVVSIKWADDWESAFDPFPPQQVASIQNAACRPATFLHYIYTTLFPSVLQNYAKAGFCAQGQSAGSGAVAYAMAYYGAGNWLDHVELMAGPQFSDVDQGCTWPSVNPVTVCGLTNCNGVQCGCQLGGGPTWTLLPTYLPGANYSVGNWTSDASCANSNNSGGTSTTSEQAWLKQSLVDQPSVSGGATPTFNYPATGMSGWLCRSVLNTQYTTYNCAANNNNNFNICPNNSSPQGQIFYANIGPNNAPPSYNVYAVDECVDAEGVTGGLVPGYSPAPGSQGYYAIQWDMAGSPPGSSPHIPAQCVRRH
jgi:hypothetical protein